MFPGASSFEQLESPVLEPYHKCSKCCIKPESTEQIKMDPLSFLQLFLEKMLFLDVWLFHTCEDIVLLLENQILFEISGVRGSF
jgi:hypothetical protein